MNKNRPYLNEYFEEARKDEPVLSLDEARSLVEGLPVQSATSSANVKLKKGFKPMHIMSIIVAAAAIGILGYNTMFDSDQTQTATVSKTEQAAISMVQERNTAPADTPEVYVAKKTSSKEKPIVIASNETETPVYNNKRTIKTIINKPKKLQVKGVNIIKLNESDLKNLGISANEDKSIQFLALKEAGHPVLIKLFKGDGQEISFDTDDYKDYNSISPRFVTDNMGNRRMSLFSNKDLGMITSVSEKNITKDKDGNIVKTSPEDSKQIKVSSQVYLNLDSIKAIDKEGRVNVSINSPNDKNMFSMEMYMALDSAFDSMPRKRINKKITISKDAPAIQNLKEYLSKDLPKESIDSIINMFVGKVPSGATAYYTSVDSTSKDMLNFLPDSILSRLQLPPTMMKQQMYLMMSDDSVKNTQNDFQFMISSDDDNKTQIAIEEMRISSENLDSGANMLPAISMGIDDIDSYIRINKLIPIAVSIDPGEVDYILWYDPSPELVELLPQRVREKLESEIKALNSNDYCNNEAIAGEDTYADIWRSCNGAVEHLNVYPNPSRGKVTISYKLNEKRKINVAVHSLTGTKIHELGNLGYQNAGEHEESFVLKDLEPGMYLISIQTEDGEQAVQRVIIK